jgi:hypothetical protein
MLPSCLLLQIWYLQHQSNKHKTFATSSSSVWAILSNNFCHHRAILLQLQNDKKRQRSLKK